MSIERGQKVLHEEAAAIFAMAEGLGEPFGKAVALILGCKGRTITCGIGKSGHIARKASGTFSSTGTPSLFLHAAEAVHGDLGGVTKADVVILYTHSGETDEIVRLFPSFRELGAKTILITGRAKSSAGFVADLVLDTGVVHEACPNNLAPTTSTTAMLALSDALAVAVMERRGFTSEDFARFHPSGTLGKRLLLRVQDVMRKDADVALVREDAPVVNVMRSITQAGAGAACVVDEQGVLAGFISDGDLRRHFVNAAEPFSATAADLMVRQVTTLNPDLLAIDAMELFQNLPRKVGEMPVLDDDDRVIGILMLKDLLRSGIV